MGGPRLASSSPFASIGIDELIEAATLSKIWNEHADRLLLIARSIGPGSDVTLAEDAVQEAFVRLASQPELPDDPMAWLVRVMRNQILQWHRSRGRRRCRESCVSRADWFQVDISESIDAATATAALMKVQSPMREIIVMHLWGDMTFESIAKVMELSRASTYRRFQSGLETLKQQLNPVDPPSVTQQIK
ncbi:RNA polymerase sigma factor [Neorhodopirellula lusitana]|uniref:RNA polymerase sigma factor n=1 Tax=Neorhodopirellula lusitana TaxID=445327 RepID=UPI00384AFAAE